MDLNKIREIRERNRQAMERERAERDAQRAEDAAREAERQARIEREAPAMLVEMVDLVLRTPGRPLPRKTIARLEAIKRRNQIKGGGR